MRWNSSWMASGNGAPNTAADEVKTVGTKAKAMDEALRELERGLHVRLVVGNQHAAGDTRGSRSFNRCRFAFGQDYLSVFVTNGMTGALFTRPTSASSMLIPLCSRVEPITRSSSTRAGAPGARSPPPRPK